MKNGSLDWNPFLIVLRHVQMMKALLLILPLLSCWAAGSGAEAAATEYNTCDISEFRCPSKDGQGSICLPMDRWCNGKDDCDNRVDEPRSCSSKYPPPRHIILTASTFGVPYRVKDDDPRQLLEGSKRMAIPRLRLVGSGFYTALVVALVVVVVGLLVRHNNKSCWARRARALYSLRI